MVCGYSKNGMTKIALGTHLGDFSNEDSEKYVNAISYALKNGILTIDGAINYRGMCSEKDEGAAIHKLMEDGILRREDFCITSKAGLLFGDILEGMNPTSYLKKVLEPRGITIHDFFEYHGLYQTLHPDFYEIALEKSLQNLGLDTLDVHYIHIPEITRLGVSEDVFYEQMERLFLWYEAKVKEGKIRYYGIALEFMGREPLDEKWHFEIEKLKAMADKVCNGNSHFKYVLFEYNLLCPYAQTACSQTVDGCMMSLADACKKLGLKTVGSMPFAMGAGFEKYSKKELLDFALDGVDHVIVGSKNSEHIAEILQLIKEKYK